MFVRAKRRENRVYLQIVENQRVDGRVRQRVLHNLGRLDELVSSGQLRGMTKSLARFSDDVAVLDAHERGESITTRTAHIGPALVFERLWRVLGVDRALHAVCAERKFQFSVERSAFLTVLHRLFDPGSDRAAERWKERYAIAGAEDLQLQHLYRAMAFLGSPLPADQQTESEGFSPRCFKDLVEEELFARRRDLLSGMDLVFLDTTSIYFEGEGGQSLGQRGHSKDHRPDLKQMVVAVVLDNEGRPVCSELWPGNTTDVKSLLPVVKRLERHFAIQNICVVADRGMISEATIEALEERQWKYILGVRARKDTQARDIALRRAGSYQEVFPKSPDPKDPAPLKVKEVRVGERRYIVCLNEDQAAKDRADREAILAALRDALKAGDKSLIGNKGFRRYVKTQGERFAIDEKKAREEERFDGKWVLRTNLDEGAAHIAYRYKQLWMVEQIFRTMKSILRTRPIYHKCDETIRGHVFCSFLALLLRKELQDRLESKGWRLEWKDIIDDLDELTETEIAIDGKGYVLRSETQRTVGKVAQACGVALPPVLRRRET